MKEENFYLTRKDGIKIKATLTKPSREGKFNAIVFCHGFSSGRNGRVILEIIKNFKEDFITLRFDFYGHNGSEGKFEDITVSKALEDLDLAINYLTNLDSVKDIGLYGSSFGGLVALLKTAKDKRIKFLALRAPAIGWKKIRENKVDVEQWEEKGFDFYCGSADNKKLRVNYSLYEDLTRHKEFEEAKKINVPVLIVHGNKDTATPLENSEKLIQINKNIKLKIIKGAGHDFEQEEHLKKLINEMVNFFKNFSK